MTDRSNESDFRTDIGRGIGDDGKPCTFVRVIHVPTNKASRIVHGLSGRRTTDIAVELASELFARFHERKVDNGRAAAPDSKPHSD